MKIALRKAASRALPSRLRRHHSLWMVTGPPFLLAFLAAANTLRNRLVYDDPIVLGIAARGSALEGVLRGRSFTYLVHRLDLWLWKDWTPGFHLTNVLLHSIASALAGLGAFALSRSRRAGLLCGLFFAVHPVHVEAIASVANRKDILAMIFVMASLVLWRMGRGRLAYGGSVVCLALAVVSKEIAALGLVPMLFMADAVLGRGTEPRGARPLRRAFARVLPLLLAGVLATAFLAGNVAARFGTESIIRTSEGTLFSYPDVLANVARAVTTNARLLVFPATLSADYAPLREARLADPQAILGMALLAVWIATAAMLLRRAPLAAFAMTWTVVTFLPASGLVPLGHFFVAERYLYVPSFGFCLLLALAGDAALGMEGRRVRWLRATAAAAIVLLLGAGAARTVARNSDWHDGYALWSSAARAGFDSWRVHHNLGRALFARGRTDEAIEEYRLALAERPELADARLSLGVALLAEERPGEAFEELREAVRLRPEDAPSHFHLGYALEALGRNEEAGREFREALRLRPDYAEANIGLGVSLAGREEYAEAAEAFRRALELRPDSPDASLHLAETLRKLGAYVPAIRQYRNLLAYGSRIGAGYRLRAATELAWVLSTCPDPALRNGKEAVRLMREVRQGTRDPEAFLTTAAARLEAGDFEGASRAVASARAMTLDAPLRQRLKRLDACARERRPYREP